MAIPFIKAQGAGNDFLITPEQNAPVRDRPAIARAICDRHRGVGADGWYLVSIPEEADEWDAEIHLYNSDGSEAELSGNGTRCVAAWLASRSQGHDVFRVKTGAGLRRLRLLEQSETRFSFSMTMGQPEVFPEEELAIPGPVPVRVRGRRVDVGNPQFAVAVDDLDFPWKTRGAELEAHEAFPRRSNISFYRVRSNHHVEARFFERGAGATLSSGTGSTGVVASALAGGLVSLPVTVETEAGTLEFWDEGDGLTLNGGAELIAQGVFYWHEGERDE